MRPVGLRCCSHHPPEGRREMTLAGEAQRKGDLADLHVRLAEQRGGLLDTPFDHVGIGGCACCRTELSREGIDRQCEQSCEIRKRDIHIEMGVDVVQHSCKCPPMELTALCPLRYSLVPSRKAKECERNQVLALRRPRCSASR